MRQSIGNGTGRMQEGDTIEFEVAPDGFNSRWTHNGNTDRGATGKWLKGKIIAAVPRSFHDTLYTVETRSKDTYYFELSDHLSSAYYGYPLIGIRKISASPKPGSCCLVEREGSDGYYYATEIMK